VHHLALLAIEGNEPIGALHAAAAAPLGNARDPAAVLNWRLQSPSDSDTVGPLRWLPAVLMVRRGRNEDGDDQIRA
jgi:hypothetical protein